MDGVESDWLARSPQEIRRTCCRPARIRQLGRNYFRTSVLNATRGVAAAATAVVPQARAPADGWPARWRPRRATHGRTAAGSARSGIRPGRSSLRRAKGSRARRSASSCRRRGTGGSKRRACPRRTAAVDRALGRVALGSRHRAARRPTRRPGCRTCRAPRVPSRRPAQYARAPPATRAPTTGRRPVQAAAARALQRGASVLPAGHRRHVPARPAARSA